MGQYTTGAIKISIVISHTTSFRIFASAKNFSIFVPQFIVIKRACAEITNKFIFRQIMAENVIFEKNAKVWYHLF